MNGYRFYSAIFPLTTKKKSEMLTKGEPSCVNQVLQARSDSYHLAMTHKTRADH